MFKAFVLVSTAVLFMGGPCALAQQTTSPKSQEVTAPQYPVVLGNQTLYYVRDIKDTSGWQYSGQGRAKAISERIKVIAENPNIQVSSITTSTFDQPLTLILAGNELLTSVINEDVLEKIQTRDQLAKEYSQKIGDAIEKYRQERSLKRRLVGILYTLIVTLVLLAALYLIKKFYHGGEAKIQAWLDSKKVHVGIQAFEVVRAERVQVLLMGGLKAIRVFIILVLFYAYLHLSLSFFPQTQAFAHHLFNYILVPLKTIGTAVAAQIPNLLFLAIIVLITVYVLKLMRLFFKGMEGGTITFKGFYPEWAQPTYRILRILIIAFAAVMAFPYIPGSDSSAFKGVSIFFGILFSLGSTSAIANIIAGYTLTYRRVFKLGDRVKIADFVGDVIATRLQVTHLRTIKNEEIVVPNSMIVNSHVMNYSSLAQEKGLILHTTVTIGYDAPWRQVHSLLLIAAERTSGLLQEPPPFILQKSLDDFYVTYELNVYTNKPMEMTKTYSDLHQNIQDAFNEHGVQIMSPHYEMDPGQIKVVPKERWYAPPANPSKDPKTKA
jgi:small-conductance mechanosensitive channel